MSMSTQAGGLHNQSDRAAMLNLSSASGRDLSVVTNKRYPQVIGGPDLIAIDEDVDEEKCSPIKPKKRTSEDSPFKKQACKSSAKGNKALVISDDDCNIDVGGFGVELDNNDPRLEEISSFNLNSGLLATPTRKSGKKSARKSNGKLSDFLDQELSGLASQGDFQL